MSNVTRADFILRISSLKEECGPETSQLIEDLHSALERGYSIGFDLIKRDDKVIHFIGKHIIAEMFNDDERRKILLDEIKKVRK